MFKKQSHHFCIYTLVIIVTLCQVSSVFGQKLHIQDINTPCNNLTEKHLESLTKSIIHSVKLANGLRIFMMENHRLPAFALRMLFGVGAGDELSGESGYAHLFEHMMFKGSKNVPDGEHFAAIKTIGGNLNASTDYDRTDYWTEVPAEYLDRVLWLEAERFKNLTLTEKNLQNQRQAVLEEKLLRIDNVPYFKVASEFMISAWEGTDYDHLIIGTEDEIKNASVIRVQAFFQQHYSLDNAILILVGDFAVNEALQKIEFYFSADVIEQKKILISDQKSNNDTSLNSDVKLSGKTKTQYDPLAPFPLYALGWHTAGKNNPDFYAVELLADILLNHDASRLKTQLKDKQALVFDIIGFPLTFKQAGITAMGMVPHSYADFSQIQAVVKNELQLLRDEGVSTRELCSAKKHRQLMILKKIMSNRHMAELIGDGVLFFQDPWHVVSALEAYNSVDREQIKRVANKYFHEDWLALEITPGPGVRLIKWLMEILPRTISTSIEQQFL